MDFDSIADQLYEVAPPEFVAARRAAVARAKEAGDKALAKELGALKKPTTTGWALNLLVRSTSESVDELVELGATLRSAQQALRGDELRQLANRRAALFSAMTNRAASEAKKRGHELPASTLREIGQSLTAALSDPEVGDDLRRGRMLGAVAYSGFGPAALTAVPTPPAEDAAPDEEASVDVRSEATPELGAVTEEAFEVRSAGAEDALVVGQLLYDFNTEFETPTPSAEEFAARFEQLLTRDDVLVLLAEREEAVGFAYLTLRPTPYGDGPLAQLEELYVVPSLRDKGIGTQLLEAAFVDVTERGAIEMHINVDEIDVDTRRFYERHGFVNIQPGTDYRMLCYLREF